MQTHAGWVLMGYDKLFCDGNKHCTHIFHALHEINNLSLNLSCAMSIVSRVKYVYIHILQEWAANYWLAGGCPKEKLIIGLATYGRGFDLTDETQTGLGAPSKDACSAGTYTREKGFLAYYEVFNL